MLNFGASKPRVKGGPGPPGPPLDPHLKGLQIADNRESLSFVNRAFSLPFLILEGLFDCLFVG